MTRRCDEPDDGVGLVGTLAGVTGFLALILLAVQVTFSLYASSSLTSIAYDAARVVTGSDGSVEVAEAEARAALGRYADRATFAWDISADTVSLRVVVSHPSFLPHSLRQPLRIAEFDRTVRIRRESFRE